MVSFLLPITDTSNKQQVENAVIELALLSDNVYEVVTEEILEEPNPYEIAMKEMQERMTEIESIEDNKEWFLAYKRILYEYIVWIDFPETIFDRFTADEIRLICRVVETETFECDFDSKVNVANVVFNRIENGAFGDTVEEVVTTERQFVYFRETITEDTMLAVMYAYEMEDTTNGALFFRKKKTDTFCGANYIFTDNVGHNFYK